MNHFYVDDMLTGGEDISKLVNVVTEVTRILSTANFNLRKWVSNEKRILNEIDVMMHSTRVNLGVTENTKTLGMIWNANSDNYTNKQQRGVDKVIEPKHFINNITSIRLGLLSPCV